MMANVRSGREGVENPLGSARFVIVGQSNFRHSGNIRQKNEC